MALEPRPYVVSKSGDAEDAPTGAVPIAMYGGGGGESSPVAFGDLTGVPAALTEAQAAGTASIRALGSTATTAAAGNHVHAASTVTVAAIPNLTGANAQLALANLQTQITALTARVVALETAP